MNRHPLSFEGVKEGRENFPRKKHGISRQESEKCEIQLRNFNFLERLGYRIPRRGKYEVSFRW